MTKDSGNRESKPDQLERYIRESRRTQKQLTVFCVLGAIASLVIWYFSTIAGFWATIITLFIGGTGYYITGMHIQGWQHELYEIQRSERRRKRRSEGASPG